MGGLELLVGLQQRGQVTLKRLGSLAFVAQLGPDRGQFAFGLFERYREVGALLALGLELLPKAVERRLRLLTEALRGRLDRSGGRVGQLLDELLNVVGDGRRRLFEGAHRRVKRFPQRANVLGGRLRLGGQEPLGQGGGLVGCVGSEFHR